MKKFQFKGSSDNGVSSWLLQRITGFTLLFVIALHIFHRDYEKFMYSIPFIKNMEWALMRAPLAILLGFGLFHAFNGFKMITDDYISNTTWRSVLLLIYWTIGVTLFILGIALIANIENFVEGV
ncbi:MAG: succinate dehydrogenase [Deferribacterota bacterium]|nr:succinate dehydrogenase [Deferribacterota bacterium]